jgi:membrane-associated PAP2 superfamily phosphatase
MSLFFLFHSARNRKRALLFGITTGWLMGTYKMLIGDHFLSHTIVTMLLAWLIICAIAAMIDNIESLPARGTT